MTKQLMIIAYVLYRLQIIIDMGIQRMNAVVFLRNLKVFEICIDYGGLDTIKQINIS